MPRLVLVRHAKSDYPGAVPDHDRPLSSRGERDAPEIGGWLEGHLHWEGSAPVVHVSTARRTQSTWGLARSRLGPRWDAATVVDDPRVYEASTSTLQEVVTSASTVGGTVILIGHNPALASLIEFLAEDDDVRRAATAKFPTSAIAVLEADEPLSLAMNRPGTMRLTAFAVPRG